MTSVYCDKEYVDSLVELLTEVGQVVTVKQVTCCEVIYKEEK